MSPHQDFTLYNIYFFLTTCYSFVLNIHQFSFHHNDGLFSLVVKVVVWVLSFSVSVVFGMCVAVLIPLVLLIPGLSICCVSIKPALCFVCQTTVCLLSSRSKQSCSHVVHKKAKATVNLLRLITHVFSQFNSYLNNCFL